LEPLQPYFKSGKGISCTSLHRDVLTRFAIEIFSLQVAQHKATKKTLEVVLEVILEHVLGIKTMTSLILDHVAIAHLYLELIPERKS
jgi:hypothetical protein